MSVDPLTISTVVKIGNSPDTRTHFDMGAGKPTICGIAPNRDVWRKRCITTRLNEEIIALVLAPGSGVDCESCKYELRAALADVALKRSYE